MSTNDNLTLFVFLDLITRRIAPNRTTLKRWMDRQDDPFPAPIVLADGKRQEGSEKPRFSGRRVAWCAVDVEAWLERRQKSSQR